MSPSRLLGGLSPAEFLKKHWQKAPLLVRNALPGYTSPLSPEELAGLACDEDVESRLILERGGDYPWQLRNGPFKEQDFTQLPDGGWTLLVHEVDRFVPQVGALLDHFRFIPNWRIDDVMVSYAPPGGSVGPHVDQYDVFLLQGLGRRRWQISRDPIQQEQLIPDLEIHVLERFEHDLEWTLEPGDMLYLPPRIAHHGVALDRCMTFSIGFRAPAQAQMLAAYAAELLETAEPSTLYEDRELELQTHPGEITPDSLERIRSALGGLLQDDARLGRWFGKLVTAPTREQSETPPQEKCTSKALLRALSSGSFLRRSSIARFAFLNDPAATPLLYVGGREHALDSELAFAATLLTGSEPLTRETLAPHLGKAAFVKLLTDLVNRGYLLLEK